MCHKPIVWTLGRSNSNASAKIESDLQTLHNFEVKGYAVETVMKVQNINGSFGDEYVSADLVASQLDVLERSFVPAAIKIDSLGSEPTNKKILSFLRDYKGDVVLDLVIEPGLSVGLNRASLSPFFPFITILILNILEAEILLNRSLVSYEEIKHAAQDLLALGVKNVLIKANRLKDFVFSHDYWSNGSDAFWLAHKCYLKKNDRAVEDTLSCAIAACLAQGYFIKDATVIAKMYVNRSLRLLESISLDVAKNSSKGWPEEELDLPYLSHHPLQALPLSFKRESYLRLGLYPIVDSADWVMRLLSVGVRTIQLRIKHTLKNLEIEIKKSVACAKKYGAQLFINDYWELAIQYGATGIHLGQEDLQQADIKKIYRAGLHLGVSSHCYYEVAHAHAIRPSYIACGPIFPTTSKIMQFNPQGITQLERWRRTLCYPLVAIGGINLERLPAILSTGVDGVALISAITKADDPLKAAQQFLTGIGDYHLCPN